MTRRFANDRLAVDLVEEHITLGRDRETVWRIESLKRSPPVRREVHFLELKDRGGLAVRVEVLEPLVDSKRPRLELLERETAHVRDRHAVGVAERPFEPLLLNLSLGERQHQPSCAGDQRAE